MYFCVMPFPVLCDTSMSWQDQYAVDWVYLCACGNVEDKKHHTAFRETPAAISATVLLMQTVVLQKKKHLFFFFLLVQLQNPQNVG